MFTVQSLHKNLCLSLNEAKGMDAKMKSENKETNEKVVEVSIMNESAIQEIMEKAISDPEFKAKLIEDPDKVLEQYNISEISRIMIKSLTAEDYEKLTPENINEYFSADSAIYTPDFDDSIEVDYAEEDEI